MKRTGFVCALLLSAACGGSSKPADTVDATPDGSSSAWTDKTIPAATGTTVYAAWASSTGELWIAGNRANQGANTQHWDGKAWSPLAAPALSLAAVMGVDDTHVYAVGASTTVDRFDGKAWSTVKDKHPGVASLDLRAVAKVGADVLVAGTKAGLGEGVIAKVDAGGFDEIATGLPKLPIVDALWSGGADAWGAGDGVVHQHGGTWKVEPTPAGKNVLLEGICGTGDSDVYVVGSQGTVLHYDGAWKAIDAGVPGATWSSCAISGGRLYLGGDTTNASGVGIVRSGAVAGGAFVEELQVEPATHDLDGPAVIVVVAGGKVVAIDQAGAVHVKS